MPFAGISFSYSCSHFCLLCISLVLASISVLAFLFYRWCVGEPAIHSLTVMLSPGLTLHEWHHRTLNSALFYHAWAINHIADTGSRRLVFSGSSVSLPAVSSHSILDVACTVPTFASRFSSPCFLCLCISHYLFFHCNCTLFLPAPCFTVLSSPDFRFCHYITSSHPIVPACIFFSSLPLNHSPSLCRSFIPSPAVLSFFTVIFFPFPLWRWLFYLLLCYWRGGWEEERGEGKR